jgi:hypothetical protein
LSENAKCCSPLVAIDGTKKHTLNNKTKSLFCGQGFLPSVVRFLSKKYIMDKILEEAGFFTLLQRFKDKRIESELIVAMTDEELTSLGVTMIADCVRF